MGAEERVIPYLKQAADAGVCGFVAPSGFDFDSLGLPVYFVNDVRLTYRLDCEVFYQELLDSFEFTGVTGTKGKTTICWLYHWFLQKLGIKSAYLGTLGNTWGEEFHASPNTTPGLSSLIKMLKSMKSDAVTHVVMEISSQGLEQERVPVRYFKDRMFTDLSPEHLDAHGTMENYFQAKLRFFQDGKFRLFCLDRTERLETLKNVQTESLIRFGLQHGDLVKVNDVTFGVHGISFALQCGNEQETLQFPMPGFFNGENFLGVLSLLCADGYKLRDIKSVLLKENPSVPGRLEQVCFFNGAPVYIDYAHSSESFEFLLKEMRTLCNGRLITVFGCGGDRDPAKRPKMGASAEKYSDITFITNDNPRTESPEHIVEQIRSGMSGSGRVYVIEDRALAIAESMDLLKPEDVLLVCGKGHEEYQIFADETIHFSDREEIKKVCGIL
jgi:UDP-N-acetylmuramoyl-L-alanyl-D-glutamate--2,6-diaminopimelate ligase